MKLSRRARRMQRHHERSRRLAAFNLVSLMDIFTILVFFLLVNSSEVQDLPSPKSIRLPESVAETHPRQTIVVMVTPEEVLVQGQKVTGLQTLKNDAARAGQALRAALLRENRRSVTGLGGETTGTRREVTIMGDRTIPFRLLKQVMLAATGAGFERISLAVLQKGAQEG